MKNNSPKRIAKKALLKNKLYSLTDYRDLKRIIESNQVTIIEYKKHSNSEYVSELIKKLGVENEIKHNDSFLYIKNNFKFLFINSNVSEDDKCSLLRHELGHIYDPDLKNSDINHSKIKKEEFANEFSLCIKNPGIGFKIYIFLIKNWKLLLTITMLTTCVLYFIINSSVTHMTKSSTNNISDNAYYITSGGKKYHRSFCITVKYRTNVTQRTLDEAISAGYKPCMICVGSK